MKLNKCMKIEIMSLIEVNALILNTISLQYNVALTLIFHYDLV